MKASRTAGLEICSLHRGFKKGDWMTMCHASDADITCLCLPTMQPCLHTGKTLKEHQPCLHMIKPSTSTCRTLTEPSTNPNNPGTTMRRIRIGQGGRLFSTLRSRLEQTISLGMNSPECPNHQTRACALPQVHRASTLYFRAFAESTSAAPRGSYCCGGYFSKS